MSAFPLDVAFPFAGRTLDLSRPHVMGVINVTPDSFSDGGDLVESGKVSLDRVLRRAEAMQKAGAAIIDVGGESTRPGAQAISSQEEMDRVLPVLEAIQGNLDVIVSVDTSNPALIRLCAGHGVGLINDVRALRREGALEAASGSGLPVCLMHMRGEPADMQDSPRYHDIVVEVRDFLADRVRACQAAGIPRERILLDPGFGFGKSLEHNLALLRELDKLLSLELPLLVGLSRKTLIGAITGKAPRERAAGSVAAAVIAVMKGAWIVRAHDVAETADALKVCTAVLTATASEGG